MDLQLKNKIAIVTGASRGLGAAVAETLSLEGAKVMINSRNPEKLQETAARIQAHSGIEVATLAGDITLPDFPAQLIEATIKHFGGLDILITNAGGPPAGRFESFSDEVWAKAVESTLFAHVRLIRSALPYLKKSQTPSVLTITSYSVKQPIPNLILSNSIRAATVGLTKSLSLELGETGIRFNSILPGWTSTERVEELMKSRSQMNSSTIEEEVKKQATESALQRLATPQEFANVAVFMVSPAASYLTGAMISVDGGTVKGLL